MIVCNKCKGNGQILGMGGMFDKCLQCSGIGKCAEIVESVAEKIFADEIDSKFIELDAKPAKPSKKYK